MSLENAMLLASHNFDICLHKPILIISGRCVAEDVTNKCSAVAEMGDHLATVDMGRKLGAVPLLGELGPHLTQCGLGQGLHPYQVTSWSIQPFGHNRHGPKSGGVPLLGGGELGPHLTQCRLSPPYQVASWSIQLFGHNRHGPKIRGVHSFWGRGELGSHLWQSGSFLDDEARGRKLETEARMRQRKYRLERGASRQGDCLQDYFSAFHLNAVNKYKTHSSYHLDHWTTLRSQNRRLYAPNKTCEGNIACDRLLLHTHCLPSPSWCRLLCQKWELFFVKPRQH